MKILTKNEGEVLKIIGGTIGAKFTSRFGNLLCKLALTEVLTTKEEEIDSISVTTSPSKCVTPDAYSNVKSQTIIDIKQFARILIERIPGGQLEDSML